MKGLMMKFILPCYVDIGKKKKSLNMNWYRNAHYMTLNATKRAYLPIGELFKAKLITISYKLIWNNKRRTDLMNWISIADKYFLDYLVTNECISDDNYKNYSSMSASIEIDTTEGESYIIAEVTVIE
jgi:hypothetical protein